MSELDQSKRRILLSWSSGKDSAWALHVLRSDSRFETCGLMTTLNSQRERVAMHGVRERLLEAQARAVGLPLTTVRIPDPCTNNAYEECFAAALENAKSEGITGVAFGDLFLEDVREYRERQMAASGLDAHFPIWGTDSAELALEMIESGVRASLTCIDPTRVPRTFAGRPFDRQLLRDLPDGADPCGENGEFHTFASDGPAFRSPVAVQRGAVVERGGFVFSDLRLVEAQS